MSLSKSISSGRDHRKEYLKANCEAGTHTHRGSCPHCSDGKTHKQQVLDKQHKQEIIESK